ncbi:MAG: ATP-dependent DNA helicase RecG [Bacilli bacterium]|nr:ATP-dependent DNA helicase RecG [Bacilli bacterium]
MQLSEIKGIGLTTEKYLNELGINSAEDLVNYFPFRYEIIENSNIKDLNDGDRIVIGGICEQTPNVFHFNRRLNKMTFRLNTGEFIAKVEIFNRAFLKSKLNAGTVITVIGKYDRKHNSITASDIKFGLIEKTLIEPIYHSSFKINSTKINKMISYAIDKVDIKDYLPSSIVEKYNFIDKKEAVDIAHFPKDKRKLNKALERLKYEELFIFMMKINYLKNSKKQGDGLERKVDYKKVTEFIETLPYKLTKDQEKSIEDIYNDLISKNRMNRLLQGDVGSGKTIVSFIALYINYLSKYQGALMAPTEILANQHYQNMKKLFPKLNIVLLKGKMRVKEKKEALESIKTGEANIIIGTHALISEDVIYKNLGLVITDEQHRFGVNQRGNLKNKGITPDILYMSATPIPRTYALTLYGDMDISSIKTMPKGRKPVETILLGSSKEDINKYLKMMLYELKKEHQIYVVAPLIEESEKIDLKNINEIEENLKKAFKKFPEYKIGIVHGKMTQEEKDKAMNDFKEGKTKILISTTVIEVGIDVKNATMMVIFDSFRFGLSALHQLRGRVGRNELNSYCVLLSDKETKRLDVLTKTNDGFKVSEEDFKLRGGGDVFGIRQSGDMNFKLSNIKEDYELLLKTKEDSSRFLKSKEFDIKENAHIKEMLINSINQD